MGCQILPDKTPTSALTRHLELRKSPAITPRCLVWEFVYPFCNCCMSALSLELE